MFFNNPNEVLATFPDIKPLQKPYVSDFGRDWDITWKDHKLSGSIFSQGEAYKQALIPILEEVESVTGKTIENFGDANRGGEGYQGRQLQDEFLNGLADLNNLIQSDNRLNHLPLFTESLIQERAGEIAKNARKEYEDTIKGFSWGNLSATMLAEGYDMVRNPLGVATLFIGNNTPFGFTAKNFGKFFLYNALAEGGYGLFTRPAVKAWRDKAGIEYTAGQVATDIGIMFAGGGVFGLGINAVGSGIKAVRPFLSEQFAKGKIKDMNGQSVNEDLIDYVTREIEDEQFFVQENPLDQYDLSNAVRDSQGRIIGAKKIDKKKIGEKIKDQRNHLNQLNESLKRLNEDADALNPKGTDKKPNVNMTKNQIQEATKPSDAITLDPDELQVDADTFQFKSGGDEFGVTDRLKDIDTWEPHFSGTVIVYEKADGTRIIVDGHQRLALAKRIKAKDPSQEPKLIGYVYKEVDGYTPEFVRVQAALKNIAEGSGTPLDAAAILRLDKNKFKSLPPRSALVQQGKYLADLDDSVTGLVVNEKIPYNYAALIGKLVEDKSKHFPIAKVLIDNNPSNEFEAEQMINQALNAGFTEVKEQTLFGQEMLTQSLFKERAKVLDSTIRLLKQDRKVFNTLVRNHTRIEREGNQLLRDANKRKEQIDATAEEILKKQANKKGGLSDSLTAIAKKYKETGNIQQATTELSEAIRRAVSEGSIDGDTTSRIGPTPETKEQVSLVAKPAEPTIKGFDDPKNSKAIEEQGNVLERQTTEELGYQEGFTSDVAAREDLNSKIKNIVEPTDDEISMIEKHPSVVKAIDDALKIKETHLAANYLTDDYLLNRQFIFKDGKIKGVNQAIEKHIEISDAVPYGKDEIPLQVKNEKKAIIIIGAPAAGKSSIAEEIARKQRMAIVDSDEIKKTLPEYGDGVGANAVHKESKALAHVLLDRQSTQGKNIIIPRVGEDIDSFAFEKKMLKEKGYTVELYYMNVTPKKTIMRMVNRFVQTGRIIKLSYVKGIGNKPQVVYNKLKGEYDGFAEIDNNQPFGQSPTIKEQKTQLLQGTGFRLQPGREGRSTGRTADDAEAARTEYTEPEVRGDPESTDNIPIATIADDGETEILTVQSRADILNEIKQDKAMIDRLEGCV